MTDAERPAPRPAWGGVARRTWRELRADGLTDWAAALTYHAVLAIFPALIVLVSLLGLAGQDAADTVLDDLTALSPGPARDIATSAIENLQGDRGAAAAALAIGLAGALWAASGYVSAFMRAANVVWDVEEGRPFWKTLPLRVAITLVALLVLAAGALAVVVSGPLAERAGDLLGLGDAAVTAWQIAKWPVIVALLAALLAILYWAAPNVRPRGIRWITPGSLAAIGLWLAASVLFAFYVANFGSYDATYGSLTGVIVFLVWLWLSNLAVLFGAELNAEIERGRQIAAGMPEEREPFAVERDPARAS